MFYWRKKICIFISYTVWLGNWGYVSAILKIDWPVGKRIENSGSAFLENEMIYIYIENIDISIYCHAQGYLMTPTVEKTLIKKFYFVGSPRPSNNKQLGQRVRGQVKVRISKVFWTELDIIGEHVILKGWSKYSRPEPCYGLCIFYENKKLDQSHITSDQIPLRTSHIELLQQNQCLSFGWERSERD